MHNYTVKLLKVQLERGTVLVECTCDTEGYTPVRFNLDMNGRLPDVVAAADAAAVRAIIAEEVEKTRNYLERQWEIQDTAKLLPEGLGDLVGEEFAVTAEEV